MARLRTLGYPLLTALIVIGLIAPTGALVASGAASAQAAPAESVSVGAGQQLSAVIVAASSDVQTEFEETAFEVELERANESERAATVAERAATLRERAAGLRESFEEARAAREAGDLSASEYAFRLATLNARAGHLLESLERLQNRSDTVSELELRAAGLNRAELRAARDDLDGVVGAGPAAILQRFTGDTEGEIRIETRDGLSISVEGERGELARELERDRDDDPSMTVSQADALETATTALSDQAGPWQLRKASVHPDSGYYKFEFVMRTANASGEAEVRVDGSSGELFRLEEEIEAERERDDEDGDDERDDDGEVSLVLADGTPRPNGNVTVQALINGSPLPNATVWLNGAVVGTTDADGRLEVTLTAGESELEVRHGDEDGELEFEFEDDDEVFRHLETSAILDDGEITLSVAYDGDPVEGAVITVNDERIGSTDDSGRLSFTAPDSESLEVEIEKGAFVAELTYEFRDGSLVLTEQAHEADDDREEGDERDDEEDHEDEDETEERDDEDREEDDDEERHDEDDDHDDADCDDESEDHDSDDDECEDVDTDEDDEADDDEEEDDEVDDDDEDRSGSNSGSG